MAEFAQTQPEACYVVSILGSKRQWTYFLATLPEALVLLEPLKKAISPRLIPGIPKRKCNQLDTDMLALMFALEVPVPCKSKPEVRFISQSVNAPR